MSQKLDISEKRNADILESHPHVNARSARSNFSRLVNTARIDNERVIITEYGEPAAAIVPINDIRILENIPDLGWVDKISDKDFEELSLKELKERLRGNIKIDSKKDGSFSDERNPKQAKKQSTG